MTTVWISLGSNLEDRKSFLNAAIKAIEQSEFFFHICQSSFYQSKAWGYKFQADFLNAVVSFKTSLSVKDCFFKLEEIERMLGRKSKGDFKARCIDIDLLFFGNHIICDSSLLIPHGLLHHREFVLKPFCELAPEFVHPVLKKSMAVLLSSLEISKC